MCHDTPNTTDQAHTHVTEDATLVAGQSKTLCVRPILAPWFVCSLTVRHPRLIPATLGSPQSSVQANPTAQRHKNTLCRREVSPVSAWYG